MMAKSAIVIPTFNRPENIERLLGKSYIPEDSLIIVSSASNPENSEKEKQVLRTFPQYEKLYISDNAYKQIAKKIVEKTKEPEIEKVLTNYGYGIGRQIGYLALMMYRELRKHNLDIVITIDDDHVLPEHYIENMGRAIGKSIPEIQREILPKREVFFSGDLKKPVNAIAGYYLWLEHLGFLETMLPRIENLAQTPGISPSSISKRIEMLKEYSLDPIETYYTDSKIGEVLLTEISKCPLFETEKTYFGGGNYAFSSEFLPDMTFKGPLSGKMRYIDDQLLFWGIFPKIVEKKDGIAIWSNCAEFANLHYPAKRDAISGIESDLMGRIAMNSLFKDFRPTADDGELSENFNEIEKGFLLGRYDKETERIKNGYVERLERLDERFKGLPEIIVDRSYSIYPDEYAKLFEQQAKSFEDFIERYRREVKKIKEKEFDSKVFANLFHNLSLQYKFRGKIIESIPEVTREVKNYLEV
jgi:hypothetical protein